MKPPSLTYERVSSSDAAVEFLAAHGEETKVLAGGQSLVALLNLRLARPEVVLDIGPADDLRGHRRVGEDLVVGALVTQRELELDPAVAETCPLLAAAIPHVAHAAIRNRGTVGGTIAHGDSSAELPVVLAALGGSVTLRSAGGERTMAAAEFFAGFLMTGARPDELLSEVRFPVAAASQRFAFLEFARRPGDFALVSVACALDRRDDGSVGAVRIALGGVDSVPVAVSGDELTGAGAEEAGAAAAALVDAAIDPPGDIHGSSKYRRHLARRLTARAVQSALE